MPSEKEMKALSKTFAYEMRIMVLEDEKENYTKEEILAFFDKFVMLKDQEP